MCRPKDGQLVCLEKGGFGEICGVKEDCKKDFICRKQSITDMRTKCLKLGKEGEPCRNNKQCTENLTCRVISANNDSKKKCLKKSFKGGFCKYPEDCAKPETIQGQG